MSSRHRYTRPSDARQSLLHNRSPPSSPGSALQTDSNVAALFPGTVCASESFENNGRFEAQHGQVADREMDPEKDGALQFVPAYEEASWDAIIDEKKTPDPPPAPSSLAARAKNFKRSRIAAQRRQQQPPSVRIQQQQQQQQHQRTPSPSHPEQSAQFPSPSSAKSETRSGGRISRLASLFSNRTTKPDQRHEIPPTPASPANSGSSSGYVGWPGTQDKRGLTVVEDDTSSARTPISVDAFADQQSDVRLEPQNEQQVSLEATERPEQPPAPSSFSAMRYAQSDIGSASHYRARLAARKAESVSSATSSAYMSEENIQDTSFPPYRPANTTDSTAVPTIERLAENNRLVPPHRTYAAAKGFSGLIDKTKEVPSLMDEMDSDSSSRATSVASRKAESDVFDGLSVSRESEVFDGIEASPYRRRRKSFSSDISASRPQRTYPDSIAEEQEVDGSEFKLVLLGGGLSAIQSTSLGFSNRQTASDFDETLTISEVDQHGFARLPGFQEMVAAGRNDKDNSLYGIQGNFHQPTSSDDGSSFFTEMSCLEVGGDLWEYYVHPRYMKQVLRQYRRLSEQVDSDMTLEEFECEEDEHKAFALLEMRSRVMEKDIDRGLERRGGTVVVDDLVTTPYNRAAQRIRDACIVSKAWRDGASPADVINSARLTKRHSTYYIKRPVFGDPSRRFSLEPVEWKDDTDFALYRCPSLGPRHMRGFEMFTVGDCQSILLKLTNEQCMNLREELNEATRRQIEAEDLLNMEGEGGAGEDTMTMAEMTYLEAMEEVKTISKKLVTAEKAFSLVRDRIQDLVTRYQALLVKIEAESCAGASSTITYESSYYSENGSEYWDERDNLERARWARRAKRAELRAELAAREALMAKQEARMIQEEKQRELDALKHKLVELQSEPSTAVVDKEHSAAAIAKNYAMHRNETEQLEQGGGVPNKATSRAAIDKEKLEGVKQRFRDRIAARKRESNRTTASATTPQGKPAVPVTPSPPQTARSLFRSAGEEMYQHLDFYERSLKAVEMTHKPM